jgi:hypothetical protein
MRIIFDYTLRGRPGDENSSGGNAIIQVARTAFTQKADAAGWFPES